MPFKAHKLDSASVEIRTALRNVADTFSYFSLLETGNSLEQTKEPLDKYDFIAAAGGAEVLSYNIADEEAWIDFKIKCRSKSTWWFGIFSYELKNVFEKSISSRHKVNKNFPEIIFFEPNWLVLSQQGKVSLLINDNIDMDPISWFKDLEDRSGKKSKLQPDRDIVLKGLCERDEYISKARRIIKWIDLGDMYEANLCIPYVAHGYADKMKVFKRLQSRVESSMAGYYKTPSATLISASPERYLCLRRQGRIFKMFSQPIKGTAPRGKNSAQDIINSDSLKSSSKERGENIMTVDLVRNDLSKVSKKNSVSVKRYLELRKLPHLFHLVSTIEGSLKKEYDWLDLIEASFPMGSMTGVPKIRVMERLDSQELSRRGWYSGALGYVSPDGECDFNVIIRSLFYENSNHRWTSWAGSALTIDSDPEREWDEINLKMDAPRQILRSKN